MSDPVRVTVETDDDHETVRFHGTDGRVSVDGATFSFDVDDVRPPQTGSDTETDGDGGEVADGTYLTTLDDVPSETTMRFEALTGRRGVEGIVQRQGESVVAWENSCAHEPDVRIDKGMGAFVADGQLICENHGARFDVDDGFCTHGPCQGQSLRPIDVVVRDGDVYVTDDRFDSCRTLGMF
ncbi:Rieske (2Fe-2S) protein [Halomarina oriensis]|uniref:Rieske 2Fe-2S domain-containing protein n=1 Tax=Halomarina oriensis TaxID=671145 RepID=A0A6B0GSU3_9EURY|nr:Rieske 2Fe-2S domain-containing protein [Halomarina oriensis]MWG36387.1 Rieske 2Fe-2S domain-containing protein [Halomarina oriensis]